MNEFIIRGTGIFANHTRYNGTYRTSPTYVSELSENSPANTLFLEWYLQEGGEAGIVSDLEKAKEMVAVYDELESPQRFEIIRIVREWTEDRPNDEEFLGLDLSDSHYYYSLLSWGLDVLINEDADNEPIIQMILPLLKLVEVHFKPLLNQNGLFDCKDDAELCLDCMMALQAIRPGLYEDPTHSAFRVVGLSRAMK